jgi:hypothetical protein
MTSDQQGPEEQESVREVGRVAAALLALEGLDPLMTEEYVAELAGDPKVMAAVLRVLERRANSGSDSGEPVEGSLPARMDVVGRLVADVLAAAMDAAPELSPEQRIAALAAAQEKLFRVAGDGSSEAG